MEIFRWIIGQAHGNPNKSGEEDDMAAKINSGKLGLHVKGRAHIYKSPLIDL
jgi:hypothetical protein